MQKIKDAFWYVALPVMAVGAFIWAILTKNVTLRNALARKKIEKDLAGTLAKKEEAAKDAKDA